MTGDWIELYDHQHKSYYFYNRSVDNFFILVPYSGVDRNFYANRL